MVEILKLDHSKPGTLKQRDELLIKYAQLHVHVFTLAPHRTLLWSSALLQQRHLFCICSEQSQ